MGGLARFKRLTNYAQHSFDVLPHVVIPKPQHTVAVPAQICVTLDVVLELRGLTMLAAVDLDHQFCRMTSKVREVRSDWRLTPKMRTFWSKFAQTPP